MKTDWKVVFCIEVDFLYDNPPLDLGWEALNRVQVNLAKAPSNVKWIAIENFNSIDGLLDDGSLQIGLENSVVLTLDYENLSEQEVRDEVLSDGKEIQFTFTDPEEGMFYAVTRVMYWAFYDLNNPSEEEVEIDSIELYQFDDEIYPNLVFDEENDGDFVGATAEWYFKENYQLDF
jgi:hypothetical protein